MKRLKQSGCLKSTLIAILLQLHSSEQDATWQEARSYVGWNPRTFRGAMLLCLLCAGCGKDTAKLASVQGKVYYRGMALQGGTIVFSPDADRGGSGPIAYSEIRPDGSYTLQTESESGAVPGWHRVTIAVNPPLLLPARYSDPELSSLQREVKPETVNLFDFRLD